MYRSNHPNACTFSSVISNKFLYHASDLKWIGKGGGNCANNAKGRANGGREASSSIYYWKTLNKNFALDVSFDCIVDQFIYGYVFIDFLLHIIIDALCVSKSLLWEGGAKEKCLRRTGFTGQFARKSGLSFHKAQCCLLCHLKVLHGKLVYHQFRSFSIFPIFKVADIWFSV